MGTSTSSCQTSDRLLIKATCGGDREAFGQLVRKYQDRLYNGMVHKSHSPVDAEDVVQEAFVQAYLKLDTFRQESSFFTWLYRIALNLAWTRRHRTRRETPFADLSEVPGTDEQVSESPGDRLTRKENCELVRSALAHLRDDQRVILMLREMQGFDYATIADLLETKVGTVRSRIHRARAALRHQLAVRDRTTGLSN
ncbi:MAG: sigma-70 family RNA polymerase sigma factor [Pirellulaceae bacterium]|nr:sigma-70 family RNA polymerase sigma factor [Pirellulaceae bacterium]MDP6556606.1 sigma-70 family RNA polymerase sigma factor [Pirellulaceae bacterium]MDP6722492.1 sigma-70 family RNA polymerase sigma factor [Pirellulaceae bacterium]